ncbi:MAG: glycosyltransferase family 2 protein [Rhizobiales bacterium]|nr:glycosyltransferase family 2 protein [Hyphomicrobiales bacterium]
MADRRFAAFSEICGQMAPPAELLVRARDAFRRMDFHTAWLLSDRLVRATGGTDPLPHVLRASALARLGRAELGNSDLAQAAFIDPFDRLANEAIIASGEPKQAEKAFRRLIDSSAEALPLLGSLARLGRSVLVRCEADDAGFSISALARHPVSVSLTCRDEERTWSIALRIDAPAGDGGALYSANRDVAWHDDHVAVALSCDHDQVLIHPATIHRPGAPSGTKATSDLAGPPTQLMLLVIVPVYDDLDATRACFDSLLANLPEHRQVRIVAVDDATPDPAIAALLDGLARSGRIALIRNAVNLGFAASVNRAMRQRHRSEDVLLLNADTIVPPHAIGRLQDIAHAGAGIGTVTPLSNNGEDTSVPCRFQSSPLGSERDVARLNDLAWQANRQATVVMPNGVGFCMLISARLLARQPELPSEYGRGYFEDVAYCLAARAVGFDNVCATGIYVGHGGSRSFLDDKRSLVRRNLERLKRAFPDYQAEADQFFQADPLARFAASLERAWLAERGAFTLVLSPDAPDQALAPRIAAGLGLDTADLLLAHVAPSPEGPALVLRGAGQHMPQNLALPLPGGHPGEADAAPMSAFLGRAAALLVVDPHRMAAADLRLIEAAGVKPAALFLSHTEGAPLPAGWSDRFARCYVPTRRLDAHFRRLGLHVFRLASQSDAPLEPRRPLRADVLYLLATRSDEPMDGLATAIGSRSATAEGVMPFTAVALAEPGAAQASGPVAWAGEVPPADLRGWLDLAGYGPCFFASRRFGVSDERIDLWAEAGIPVAHFDPDVEQVRADRRRLLLPVGLGHAAVAAALAQWMAALAAPAGAPGVHLRQKADRVENGV